MNRRVRFEVLERDSFKCIYCGASGEEEELEVDHVHPRSAGGSDDLSNLETACFDCKKDRVIGPEERIRGLQAVARKGFFEASNRVCLGVEVTVYHALAHCVQLLIERSTPEDTFLAEQIEALSEAIPALYWEF